MEYCKLSFVLTLYPSGSNLSISSPINESSEVKQTLFVNPPSPIKTPKTYGSIIFLLNLFLGTVKLIGLQSGIIGCWLILSINISVVCILPLFPDFISCFDFLLANQTYHKWSPVTFVFAPSINSTS